MEIEMPSVEYKKADAKILNITAKVGDCFSASLYDEKGMLLKDYNGYVPGFMPGQHFGDYLMLEIDIDTGQIKNWKQPSAEAIETFIAGGEE